MKKIFISSTGVQSGQSLAAWCVGEMLHSQGLRVGFFKPFVTRPVSHNGQIIDKDALLMKEYFNLPEELSLLCPVVPEEVDDVTAAAARPPAPRPEGPRGGRGRRGRRR